MDSAGVGVAYCEGQVCWNLRGCTKHGITVQKPRRSGQGMAHSVEWPKDPDGDWTLQVEHHWVSSMATPSVTYFSRGSTL